MFESGPLVSIIVRTKDRPDLLRQAIKSLALQTYRDVEVVIVNDGSSDVSKIATPFEHCFKHLIIVSSDGKGRTRAANLGLQMAAGEWIGFLDDDDLYVPTSIEKVVPFLLKEERPFYGRTLLYDMVTRQWSGTVYKPFVREELFWSNYIPIISLFVPARLAKSLPFDESFELFEDWDWIYRLSLLTDFSCAGYPVAVYRLHESCTIRKENEKHRYYRKLFYLKHLNKLGISELLFIEGNRLALRCEVDDLKQVIEKVNEELNNKNARMGELEWEVENLKRFLQDLRQELDYKNARLGELEWEVNDLKSVLQEKDRRIRELEWELERTLSRRVSKKLQQLWKGILK